MTIEELLEKAVEISKNMIFGSSPNNLRTGKSVVNPTFTTPVNKNSSKKSPGEGDVPTPVSSSTPHYSRGYPYVVGYEGIYSIDKLGNIFNIKTKKVIKSYPIDKHGWQAVSLSKNRVNRNIKVHRAVAQAYIPNPFNKPAVNHIDGNKKNNHHTNLEWVTHQENTDHAKANGLMWFQKREIV